MFKEASLSTISLLTICQDFLKNNISTVSGIYIQEYNIWLTTVLLITSVSFIMNTLCGSTDALTRTPPCLKCSIWISSIHGQQPPLHDGTNQAPLWTLMPNLS